MSAAQAVTGDRALAADRNDPRVEANLVRITIIAVTAFLTLVDLFAVQAVLPTLSQRFGVSAGTIGVAANASTFGMAIASLAAAIAGQAIAHRAGIAGALALLALPTAALSFAPDIATFAALRFVQGLLMATAFTLMLSYLGEHFCPKSRPGAFAAFVAGNVLSNVVGRIVAAGVTDGFGVENAFFVFAALNFVGALLVFVTVQGVPQAGVGAPGIQAGLRGIRSHLANPQLKGAFVIGFLILFAFIGVFSFVNFVLSEPRFGLSPAALGWIYLLFLPSLVTTLAVGKVVARIGAMPTIIAMLLVALIGLPMLLADNRALILGGLALVAIGTFGAQAAATGHIGGSAQSARGAASGLYLGAYFAGGIVGSLIVGQLFERIGWAGALAAVATALGAAMAIAWRLHRLARAT